MDEPGTERRPRRAAAFFDVDRTLLARSATLAFGRSLRREGMVSSVTALKGAYTQLAYQRRGADAGDMERYRLRLLRMTRGWDADRLSHLVQEALVDVLDPLVYAEGLALLDQHRREGRALYLVSSSGVEVVQPLAEHLGVPNAIATRAGVDADGRYDGTLDFYCYADAKADAVRAAAVGDDLDLDSSFAYSDSITDLPLLEAVGNPVAVNPDRRLRAVARDRSWPVVDFRDLARARPVSRSRPVVAGAGALGAAAVAGWVARSRMQGARQ
ncbi:MAG: HAD-IB family hydrolase [Actinobacteria bacterium]|nr:HAD-IB family hydrolase [Actinomycetota bacterium]